MYIQMYKYEWCVRHKLCWFQILYNMHANSPLFVISHSDIHVHLYFNRFIRSNCLFIFFSFFNQNKLVYFCTIHLYFAAFLAILSLIRSIFAFIWKIIYNCLYYIQNDDFVCWSQRYTPCDCNLAIFKINWLD